MVKRTLYFGNPAYLSLKLGQLVITLPASKEGAAFYWKNVFCNHPEFIRDQFGEYPNNLLNYGYAVLRAMVARALVCVGLLPTLGIHHHNRYNAYCLADDIMEPYRPYVDRFVLGMMESMEPENHIP